MTLKIYQVDAFTNRPFAGNPAAVCILPGSASDDWMHNVAREMNLSETAFLHPDESGDGYRLRWLTPSAEVSLCGHATLASAHTLWESGHLPSGQQARFQTKSGLLTAEQRGDWIELNFPARTEESVEPAAGLLSALGLDSTRYIGRSKSSYIVEVESEAILHNMQPDFTRLVKLPVRGVIVTCRPASGPYDFLSRFFAPAIGINEDPVTGSAHCCLVPYWSSKLGKKEMFAYQASARGGELRLRLEGDRVVLGGQAVTVLAGELLAGELQAG